MSAIHHSLPPLLILLSVGYRSWQPVYFCLGSCRCAMAAPLPIQLIFCWHMPVLLQPRIVGDEICVIPREVIDELLTQECCIFYCCLERLLSTLKCPCMCLMFPAKRLDIWGILSIIITGFWMTCNETVYQRTHRVNLLKVCLSESLCQPCYMNSARGRTINWH